jgi:poly(3-hydroxybutyrate) depolymerase
VFLHGASGDERIGPFLWEDHAPARGYVVASPASSGPGWLSAGEDLAFVARVTKALQAEFDVPRRRTLVVGHSAGGAAVYFYFLTHPDLAAAVAPVNACLQADLLRGLVRERKVRILLLNGENDGNRASVEKGAPLLRRNGYRVQFGILRGEGHGYRPAIVNPVVLDWHERLLRGSRPAATEPRKPAPPSRRTTGGSP